MSLIYNIRETALCAYVRIHVYRRKIFIKRIPIDQSKKEKEKEKKGKIRLGLRWRGEIWRTSVNYARPRFNTGSSSSRLLCGINLKQQQPPPSPPQPFLPFFLFKNISTYDMIDRYIYSSLSILCFILKFNSTLWSCLKFEKKTESCVVISRRNIPDASRSNRLQTHMGRN